MKAPLKVKKESWLKSDHAQPSPATVRAWSWGHAWLRPKSDYSPSAYNGRRAAQPRRPAVLRLFQAERSEEIFPLLLEEIIALGNPRALVVDVNFDSGEVTPAAALKWPRAQMDNFSSALWMQTIR